MYKNPFYFKKNVIFLCTEPHKKFQIYYKLQLEMTIRVFLDEPYVFVYILLSFSALCDAYAVYQEYTR